VSCRYRNCCRPGTGTASNLEVSCRYRNHGVKHEPGFYTAWNRVEHAQPVD
jgi:hypothetical protein